MGLGWRDVMRACWEKLTGQLIMRELCEECARLRIENAALRADNEYLQREVEHLAFANTLARSRAVG